MPVWAWVAFTAFVLLALALDLGVWHRRAHVVGPREAALWTAGWVAAALLFALGLAVLVSGSAGLTFLTGYLIEESLSADNVFVIALIFGYLRIPAVYQHRVLFWGIIGAIAMRGAFIAAGTYLLGRFGWVEYVFGAILLVAAVRVVRERQSELHGERNVVLRVVRRVLPVRLALDGQRLVTRDPARGGRWAATPLLVALVMVEISDVAFATDSIPAVLAVTRDPFIVFTSTVFAVLGLRSLYFLLADAMRRFRYLPVGLALILAFVGAKMLLASVVLVSPLISLAVVLTILAATIVASLAASGDRPAA